MAHAADVSITDNRSFEVIFKNSRNDFANTIDDYDILVYFKAFDFALNNIDELGMVEWSSPGSTIIGKTTIISRKQPNKPVCKSFIHSIIIGKKIFEGDGFACKIKDRWIIKKS